MSSRNISEEEEGRENVGSGHNETSVIIVPPLIGVASSGIVGTRAQPFEPRCEVSFKAMKNGRHRGRLFGDIACNEKEWTAGVVGNPNPSEQLFDFIQYVDLFHEEYRHVSGELRRGPPGLSQYTCTGEEEGGGAQCLELLSSGLSQEDEKVTSALDGYNDDALNHAVKTHAMDAAQPVQLLVDEHEHELKKKREEWLLAERGQKDRTRSAHRRRSTHSGDRCRRLHFHPKSEISRTCQEEDRKRPAVAIHRKGGEMEDRKRPATAIHRKGGDMHSGRTLSGENVEVQEDEVPTTPPPTKKKVLSSAWCDQDWDAMEAEQNDGPKAFTRDECGLNVTTVFPTVASLKSAVAWQLQDEEAAINDSGDSEGDVVLLDKRGASKGSDISLNFDACLQLVKDPRGILCASNPGLKLSLLTCYRGPVVVTTLLEAQMVEELNKRRTCEKQILVTLPSSGLIVDKSQDTPRLECGDRIVNRAKVSVKFASSAGNAIKKTDVDADPQVHVSLPEAETGWHGRRRALRPDWKAVLFGKAGEPGDENEENDNETGSHVRNAENETLEMSIRSIISKTGMSKDGRNKIVLDDVPTEKIHRVCGKRITELTVVNKSVLEQLHDLIKVSTGGSELRKSENLKKVLCAFHEAYRASGYESNVNLEGILKDVHDVANVERLIAAEGGVRYHGLIRQAWANVMASYLNDDSGKFGVFLRELSHLLTISEEMTDEPCCLAKFAGEAE